MTHLRLLGLVRVLASLTMALAPLSALAVTPLYTQGEAAMDRAMNDFYRQAVAGPVTPQRLDELERKVVEPVVRKYDDALMQSWKTTVEKRIRLAEQNAAAVGRRSLQDPVVAKALGVKPGSIPAASAKSDSGGGRHSGEGSSAAIEGPKVTVDGTNVPKVLEFEEKKKPKRAYQPYVPTDSH